MSGTKVIFVTPYWGKPRTGPEVYARYLWESFLDDLDIEFHLVAAGEPASHPRLHLITRPHGSLSLYRSVAQHALKLAQELGCRGVLHVNNSNFHHSLLRSPWPIIGQINDYEAAQFSRNAFGVLRQYGPRRFLAMWRRAFLERRFVHSQAVTLCNSAFTRDQVRAAYGTGKPGSLRVVYKAVDVDSFVRPSAPIGSSCGPGDLPILLFIGADFRRKGLDVLVKALINLGKPVRLRVVGVTRDEFDRAYTGLVSAAEARGAAVDFLGLVSREAIPSVLWHADVFCMPSRSEALGVALLEALAAGLPCVATSVGGIPEIARHFPAVRLVRPADPAALVDALNEALFGHRIPIALDRIRELFSRDAMVSAVKKTYLELS